MQMLRALRALRVRLPQHMLPGGTNHFGQVIKRQAGLHGVDAYGLLADPVYSWLLEELA